MFQEEEEKKNENVINTCNKYIGQRVIKTVNITHNDFSILEDFEKVSSQESGKRGFSETVVKAIKEYVIRHGRGNNQLLMSNYVTNEPTPSAHLCHYGKGNTNDGQVFCSNPQMVKVYEMVIFHGIKGLWISGITCYSCMYNKMRKKEEK